MISSNFVYICAILRNQNKTLIELKVIFLEIVYEDLDSGKVSEILIFFSFCTLGTAALKQP